MVDVHSFLQRALRKVEQKIVVITDHLLYIIISEISRHLGDV